ncbi:hypothetical protein ACP70R_041966 [Stipagrostis hirtigluma subsp. patula]
MAPQPAGGRLNAKHYILAALTATLVVAAVVTVVSVVLSPARVHFSVTDASNRRSGDGGVQLFLAVAANNTSRRAAVAYQSMFVDVSNSTAPGGELVNWVRANVTTEMPLRQPPRSVATIAATVSLVGGPWAEDFTGNMTSSFKVTVTAVARFKVGIARTRLFDIKVACGPVSFFSRAGGSSATAGRPVDCHI